VVLSLSLTIDACGDEADCMWADFRDSFTLPKRETYKGITLVVKKLLPGLRSFRLLFGLVRAGRSSLFSVSMICAVSRARRLSSY
jgi:hypothetical protein